MESSPEYAIKRLDDWVLEKFLNNYTDDLAMEAIAAAAKQVLGLRGTVSLERFGKYRESIQALKRETMVEHFSTMFSKSYSGFQKNIEEWESEEDDDQDESETFLIAQEVKPVWQRLTNLVNSVRAAVDANFPDDVELAQIDDLFIAEFTTPREFIRCSLTLLNALMRRGSEAAMNELDNPVIHEIDADALASTLAHLSDAATYYHIGEIIGKSLEEVIDRVFQLPKKS